MPEKIDNGDNKKPRICTVAISAWNAADWVEECVRSVLAQEMPDGWVLDPRIGTDGCPESSQALERAGITHYVNKTNAGTYVMFNSLFALDDRWDLGTVFGADDVMLPGYLKALIEHSLSSSGLAMPWWGAYDGSTGPVMSRGICMFPRDLYRSVGGFRPERVGMDSDFIDRLRKKHGLLKDWTKDAVFLRRIRDDSLTRSKKTGMGGAYRTGIMERADADIAAGKLVIQPETVRLVRKKGHYADLREELEKRNTSGHMNIVQIGANDGRTADPVYGYIMAAKERTSVLLIEPQPEVFEELKKNYRDHPDARFVRCAAGRKEGVLTLYRLKKDRWKARKGLPAYRQATGAASADPETALKPDPSAGLDDLDVLTVPCRRLENIIAEHMPGEKIDLVITDTEGADAEIVEDLTRSGLRPGRILFEHCRTPAERMKTVRKELKKNGYVLIDYKEDTLAVRK